MTRSILYLRKHQSALTIEPATLNGYFEDKVAKQVIALDAAWQDYMFGLVDHNLDVWNKIIDPAWGPTTGIQNGKVHLIVNGFWLNPINELVRQNGWVTAACLNGTHAPPTVARVNRASAPDIIHRVTMQNRLNQLVYNSNDGMKPNDNAYVPMVTNSGFIHFPASIVAQAARATALPWLNIRTSPSASADKIGTILPYINSVYPLSIEVGEGGVWARVFTGKMVTTENGILEPQEGYVALRYNGKQMTGWVV